MYKTRITDLDRLTMPLTNDCCNYDVIQLGPFSSQLLFRFVHCSGEKSVYMISAANLFRKPCTKFHQRYYEKYFGLSFFGHTVLQKIYKSTCVPKLTKTE